MQVLIVDNDPSAHQLLASLLSRTFEHAEIRWERTLGGAMAHARASHDLHLVVLDIALPGLAGIEALTTFHNKFPKCRVVVFSQRHDRGNILAALATRAVGFIPKEYSPELVSAALRVVAAGGTYIPQGALPDQIRVPVTRRQRDVLRLLLDGHSNERIASQLCISKSTVKQHTRALFDAMGVSTRAQLIATAARRGIHAHNH